MQTTAKIEQFWLSGPRGRLDGETLAFIACLAREELEHGGSQ
jgi:hypothetical protein